MMRRSVPGGVGVTGLGAVVPGLVLTVNRAEVASLLLPMPSWLMAWTSWLPTFHGPRSVCIH
jgi:hypothetical protein